MRIEWEMVAVRRKAGDMLDRWKGRWANNVARYSTGRMTNGQIAFYRVWSGVEAAFGAEFLDRWNGAAHQAAGFASDVSPDRAFDVALTTLRSLAEKMRPPPEPRPIYSWNTQDD